MASVTALQPAAKSLAAADALVLEGVSRAFGALRAIEDISFSVAVGERRAVLGANGAGKTTLFNAITGDFPPTAGRVRFFGEDITDLPPYERIRRGLRRTYQSSLLFRNLTVRDNLFLATRGVSRGRFSFVRPRAGHPSRVATQDLLDRTRLAHLSERLVSELSHGELRQLEIGMALAGAPRMVLFDEPAAGLSPGERVGIRRLLHGLPADLTLVMIEHDMDLVRDIVNRITVLHFGQVVAEGSPQEIQRDETVRAIYLGSGQAGG